MGAFCQKFYLLCRICTTMAAVTMCFTIIYSRERESTQLSHDRIIKFLLGFLSLLCLFDGDDDVEKERKKEGGGRVWWCIIYEWLEDYKLFMFHFMWKFGVNINFKAQTIFNVTTADESCWPIKNLNFAWWRSNVFELKFLSWYHVI